MLAVCADDFGLSPAVSRGIAALAQQGRLNAISCLSSMPAWPASAPLLAALPAEVERGLHFNLSEGEPVSAELRALWPAMPPLPRLIALAHLRQLPLPAIAAEWRAQWQCFVAAAGAAPRFVDGHQHVHHLPGVRGIVLQAAADRPGLAVRSTGRVIGPGHALKRRLIEHTGGRALQRALRAGGIPHNAALVGAYDFVDPDYRRCVQRWLAALPDDGGLLFCHPAAADPGATTADPIAAARLREAAYLGSAAFADDLAAAGVSLGPAWQRRSSAG